jgi:hypothetical protein
LSFIWHLSSPEAAKLPFIPIQNKPDLSQAKTAGKYFNFEKINF